MNEPTAGSPSPLTEEHIERLEALLDAPPLRERAPSADALQGLCVALAIGPDDAPPARWIHAALGLTGDPPDDGVEPDIAPELRRLLELFMADTFQRARDGTLSLLLYSLRRGRADYGTWCQGFLAGVELSEAGWYDSADPEEVDELLFPLFVLGDELTAQERASYTPAGWRKLVLDAEAGLDQTLMRIRDYWAIVRSPPRTVRRAAPRQGRNDPCACGSGRKFKQCCGA